MSPPAGGRKGRSYRGAQNGSPAALHRARRRRRDGCPHPPVRRVANEACDNARVTANGRPVKASYDVKAGDVLELRFGERTVKVEVLSVAEHVGKADAPALYKELL